MPSWLDFDRFTEWVAGEWWSYLVIFAIANFEPVPVNFLLFSTSARVFTVIVVSAILGFVIGYYVGRPGRADRRLLRDSRRRKD